jgi:hypothetical protein
MRDPSTYREKAAQFRKMAAEADEKTAAELLALADDYETLALQLEPEPNQPRPE